MSNDPTTDIGFAMCLLGLILIITFGVFLPQSKERFFNKIVLVGSIISALGGLILLARIA